MISRTFSKRGLRSLATGCPWKVWTIASGSHRGIHARASQMPDAERRRKLEIPMETYQSPATSRCVLAPTDSSMPGRSKHTAKQRESMQWSKSIEELLQNLGSAIDTHRVDASVFGAAMQRCGQSRWWDALLTVRMLQKSSGMSLFYVQRNTYLAALRKSVRKEGGFGVVLERQQKAVALGKQVWEEVRPTADDTIGLNAALHLCAAGIKIEGLEWAEELWQWAKAKGLPLTNESYSAFALVLEGCQLSDRVDEILAKHAEVWAPDCVALGQLVNSAAEQRNWRRAEELWTRLVVERKVTPHTLAYGARAKAHLLCGRPAAAAHVIDEMLGCEMALPPEIAESHVQCLLIAYHSSLEENDFRRLGQALSRGEPVISKASLWQRKTWTKMKHVMSQLRENPQSLHLRDVLVEWKAQQSEMSKWQRKCAGSRYLTDA